ncbi:MAG: hypothetical protein ACUVXI_02455 [bacterium]
MKVPEIDKISKVTPPTPPEKVSEPVRATNNNRETGDKIEISREATAMINRISQKEYELLRSKGMLHILSDYILAKEAIQRAPMTDERLDGDERLLADLFPSESMGYLAERYLKKI